MGVCESTEGGDPEESEHDERDRKAALERRKNFSEQQLEAEDNAKSQQKQIEAQKDKASKRELVLVMRLEPRQIAITLMVTDSVTVAELHEEAYTVFSEEADVFEVPPKVEGLVPLWGPTTVNGKPAPLTHLAPELSMASAGESAPAGLVRLLLVHDEEDKPPTAWRSKPAEDPFWTSDKWTRLESKRPKFRQDREALESKAEAERAKLQAQLEADEAAARAKDKAELEAKMAEEFKQRSSAPPAAARPPPQQAVVQPVGDLDDLLGLGGPAPTVQPVSGGNSASFDLLGMGGPVVSQPTQPAAPADFGSFTQAGDTAGFEPVVHQFDMSAIQDLPQIQLEPSRDASSQITPASFEGHWGATSDAAEFKLELAEPLGMPKLKGILQKASLHNIAALENPPSGYVKVFHMGQLCGSGELVLVQLEVERRRSLSVVLKGAPSSLQLLQRFERHLRLLISQKLKLKR